MSPYESRCARYSFVGPGNSSRLSVGRRQCARPSRSSSESPACRPFGRTAVQGPGAEGLGPAAGRDAELPAEEADHRVGHVELAGIGLEVLRFDARTHQMQREVSHHLRRWRHLHQPSEHPVGGGVEVLDQLEPVAQSERDGLLAQVGQLAAGDLVVVDAAGGRGQPGLERPVDLPDGLPVRLEVAHGGQREAGGAFRVVGGRDQSRERGLRRRARHRRHRRVDGVHTGLDRRDEGRELAARGVVGVQVHGQVEPLAQGRDQPAGRRRPQQTGHVLDREHVRARRHDLLGEAQVVVERVETSRRGRRGRRCSRAPPRRWPCPWRAPRRSRAASARRR